jgi:hypothetical protein
MEPMYVRVDMVLVYRRLQKGECAIILNFKVVNR